MVFKTLYCGSLTTRDFQCFLGALGASGDWLMRGSLLMRSMQTYQNRMTFTGCGLSHDEFLSHHFRWCALRNRFTEGCPCGAPRLTGLTTNASLQGCVAHLGSQWMVQGVDDWFICNMIQILAWSIYIRLLRWISDEVTMVRSGHGQVCIHHYVPQKLSV